MIRSSRIGIIHLSLAVFALAVIAKSAQVQLVQGRSWAQQARAMHTKQADIPAARGLILDAAGRKLAESRDVVTLSIAPREVRDPRALRNALLRAGVDRSVIARATDSTRAWVVVPGQFLAMDVAPLTAMRGVYADETSDRTYLTSESTRRIVGRVNAQGEPLDGLELALDSLLRGRRGQATLVRDARGHNLESPTAPGRAPQAGNTVVLTLNTELQQITERALSDAVDRMGAEGGDIVIMDPSNGEILAMASRRLDPRSTSATALSEPFEPGSTMKPLVAAALLTRGLARPTDMIPTHGGVLTINGRTVHDDREEGPEPDALSLADVIRRSSNVGIIQFAERLTSRQEYEALRDYGFGTPTGLPYSAESNGTLRPPRSWSLQTGNSMAMGYEIAVTPVQLATAYASIANGGELLQPALVKEIRDPDGHVLYRHARRVVRRVMTEHAAAEMRHMLLGVVENGTAVQADLANYQLGGKTGTPRRTVNGRYAPMQYNPNFVGLFPGDAPQFVIVVKLDNPKSSIYSGKTAAPLTKTILEAAIAARDAALDRDELARRVIARAPDTSASALALANARRDPLQLDSLPAAGADSATPVREAPPVVDATFALPLRPPPPAPGLPPRPVPDVHALPLRDAVRALHDAGFRVQLVRGASPQTWPAAGVITPAGAVVRLQYDF